MLQTHCHYRAIAKFGDSAVGFDSEDSSTGGYYNGTSSYWVEGADQGGNVGFYFERVQELQTLHWQYTMSQSYWDKQDGSHNCEAEGRPYEPELFYKYHYQLLLPYLAPGTARYDGYPFATGCVRCVIGIQSITQKLPQLALSAAADLWTRSPSKGPRHRGLRRQGGSWDLDATPTRPSICTGWAFCCWSSFCSKINSPTIQ